MAVRRQGRGESGFTLVELMVSLTVLSVAIAAAFALAFSLMNGFRDHRRAVNVESSTRIVLDILASGVRAASPGMVSGQVWNPCTGLLTDTIVVVPSSTGPDQLEVIHALGGAYASLPPGTAGVGNQQDISSGTIAVDDSRLFETGMWVPAIIVEPGSTTSKAHLVEVFATAANSTTMSVRSPGGCPATWFDPSSPDDNYKTDADYDPASFVLRAIHVSYSVVPPLLYVDPDGPGALPLQVMAEGIEDLQIAVGIENGTDAGSLSETVTKTDDEWFYNDSGDAAPAFITAGGWRALRITVVGVDSRETRQDGVNLRPAVEDRAAATVKDPFRRRVFSTTVQLRNFESSQ